MTDIESMIIHEYNEGLRKGIHYKTIRIRLDIYNHLRAVCGLGFLRYQADQNIATICGMRVVPVLGADYLFLLED
jgi:hypothetical protein